jgi:hypothetical protein
MTISHKRHRPVDDHGADRLAVSRSPFSFTALASRRRLPYGWNPRWTQFHTGVFVHSRTMMSYRFTYRIAGRQAWRSDRSHLEAANGLTIHSARRLTRDQLIGACRLLAEHGANAVEEVGYVDRLLY